MKNYADLGGCYPPSASADNTLIDLHNSSYHTQPHPIIANYFAYSTQVALNSKNHVCGDNRLTGAATILFLCKTSKEEILIFSFYTTNFCVAKYCELSYTKNT